MAYQLRIKTSIDCTVEEVLVPEKPYLFSLIPLVEETIIDDEVVHPFTELDAMDEDEQCIDENDSCDVVPGEEVLNTSIEIDAASLDIMLDKLKKLYVLKKLILNKPNNEKVHGYEHEVYQEISQATDLKKIESTDQIPLQSQDRKITFVIEVLKDENDLSMG